ncbi:MAG TPA: sn-glycerol-3-phosphate ABC transporter ATP-binding protein UgpC [Gammaproteobacteria bacterium]
MAAIQLRDVVKAFGGFRAVDGVTLDIADGELMIIVGPSGCGKSTLLRMIAGLEDVTSGDVLIGGERVNDKPPRERNLAMVFQSYALYPHLTVYDNIAFPLRLAKLPEREVRAKVERAADMLELEEQLTRKPSELSGGQRQRVAMGRAIVRDARAFLFDEPLSNLDARLRAQMRAEIARLQRRLGTTTVYVTHDQTEAMTLGDRVAVLRKGVLQQCAAPRELYERPANLFVAAFIGAPPMTLLPARLEQDRLALPFLELPPPPDVDAASLRARPLVAGIRPESCVAAERVAPERRPRGATFEGVVDVIEWLGHEQYAHVAYELAPDAAQALQGLAAALDYDELKPRLIASLDPASRVREGERARFWIDGSKLYVFDAATGENLRART